MDPFLYTCQCDGAEALAKTLSHPLPSLSHFTYTRYDTIYEPREDTYLLTDALHHRLQSDPLPREVRALEIGVGRGVNGVTVAGVVEGRSDVDGVNLMGTDVNLSAVKAAEETLAANGVVGGKVAAEVRRADFAGGESGFDLIVFNPPYVPTPSDEVGSDGIEAAWAGGLDGREVTDVALPIIAEALNRGGWFYLVVVDENRPREIIAIMEGMGCTGEVLVRRRAKNEALSVLLFRKKQEGA